MSEVQSDRDLKRTARVATGEYVKRADGVIVCAVCGGDCGQCGNTGIVDNVPASMDGLSANLLRITPEPESKGVFARLRSRFSLGEIR